jgi:hypothetical protein
VPPGVTPPVGRSLPSLDALVLAPFRGVRFDPAITADVDAAPAPEHSVLPLIIPRERAGRVAEHARAASGLARRWLRSGVLVVDEQPGLYLYEVGEEASGAVTLRGLVGALQVGPAGSGAVRPHERTLPGPVAHRLALLRAGAPEVEPLVVLHTRGAGGGEHADRAAGLREVLAGARRDAPLAAVRLGGAEHRIWSVRDPATLQRVAGMLLDRRGVLADGHHRWEASQRLLSEQPASTALTLLVDGDVEPPRVEAIHRVLPGVPPTAVAQRLAARGRVSPLAVDAPPASLRFGSPTGMWSFVPTAGGELDVDVLDEVVLPAVTADAVEFEVDAEAAVHRAGRAGGTAFLLRPPPLPVVLRRALAGRLLPPKATSFVPKPSAGMVMRLPGLGL